MIKIKPIKGRNSVYQIKYHIVWCTKYRKPVLEGNIKADIDSLLRKIAKDKGVLIEEMDIMPDHVHMFISANPNILIADTLKALKGVSARFLFKKHPELKEQLYGGHLWNPSYYVGTVGGISKDTVKSYIDNQKRR